ncbi:iron complex outermembrane receptor protein [Novosphingobium sp. PhB57]|uniref:TonB-dependent receptor n=1 Tax=Novosphingobium sp. PhB57 TaxID=2485107 RepID=UPI001042B529|nr:TonB-dependent receptor [Novosphingobium sp. PhB57]TCU57784.1 iron complex outermembrane receptor protein [Novosphingobium sp. PhB57]
MSLARILPSFLLGASTIALLGTDPASAEEAPSSPAAEAALHDDGEILVTARRRQERAQDVPISLSTVDDRALVATGFSNLTQISTLTPSLAIRGTNARNTYINIRGLGSNSTQNDGLEIGVGVYVDDVYYGRVGSSQFDLIDLDHVEVLRGPQGTLFGKNTTAGAISIATREPSFEPEFRGEVSLGENGYRQFRASGSTALVPDRLALRLTASRTLENGYFDNAYNGGRVGDSRNTALRGQLLFLPSERVKIRLIGDYSRQAASGFGSSWIGYFTKYDNGATISNNIIDRLSRLGYAQPGAFGDPYARVTALNAPTTSHMNSGGASGKVDVDLDWATLTSITAYRQWNWYPQNDTDGTALDINPIGGTGNRQRQFSQEVRLASQGERKLDYVVGLYYFHQIIHALSQYALGSDYAAWNNPTARRDLANYAYAGFEADSAAQPKTDSYAAFGQTTWHVSDALSLTAGLRFTHEDRQASYDQYAVAGNDLSVLSAADQATAQALRDALYPATSYFRKVSDNALTGQINIAYKIAPDILAFASYARGVKSGGVNVGQLPAGVSGIVDPEKVNAYEVGLKSQFWDRRITANLAGFWTEVQDYQAAIAEQIGTTTSYRRYISNIPGVRSRGVEADLSFAPTRQLRLTASGAYTDATYKEYPNAQAAAENRNLSQTQDLSGVQLPNISKFTYALSADWTHPVRIVSDDELYLRADFNHRSSYKTDETNSRYSKIPGYGVLNARLGVRLEDGRWDLSIWARNLLDKNYLTTLTTAATGLITAQIGNPRQVGGTLRVNF